MDWSRRSRSVGPQVRFSRQPRALLSRRWTIEPVSDRGLAGTVRPLFWDNHDADGGASTVSPITYRWSMFASAGQVAGGGQLEVLGSRRVLRKRCQFRGRIRTGICTCGYARSLDRFPCHGIGRGYGAVIQAATPGRFAASECCKEAQAAQAWYVCHSCRLVSLPPKGFCDGLQALQICSSQAGQKTRLAPAATCSPSSSSIRGCAWIATR